MAGVVFYRDPRSPRDVSGPFTVDQLRELVKQGRLRAADQVSFDQRSWLPATEFEPELFPGSSAEWLGSQPAWKRSAIRVVRWLQTAGNRAWLYLQEVARFYWDHRKELRFLATEYLQFLKEPGKRREIRVSADDHNEAVSLDGDQWRADLPDCCVVCGEPANCDWNREQRSLTDLTWPFLSPLLGFLFGLVAWLFSWSAQGRWLILCGIFAGFLVGYRLRRETIVAVRFRRCREHLNRTKLPWLRVFRKTLIIGVGDRRVWRRFYYGDQDIETPIAVPQDFSQIAESKRRKEGAGAAAGAVAGEEKDSPDAHGSYPTIPLAGDAPNESENGPPTPPI